MQKSFSNIKSLFLNVFHYQAVITNNPGIPAQPVEEKTKAVFPPAFSLGSKHLR